MTLASFLLFLVPALIGGLLIHMLWPERKGLVLLLKLSLGVGAGLGISSMLYFLALLIAPGRLNVFAIQAGLLIGSLIVVVAGERGMGWPKPEFPALSHLQWGLLALSFVALMLTGLIFYHLTVSRPQGAFDAWSIWDRAARFIYRDPQNWQATLSPDLYWGTHADYPLLVPLNVAWGWEAVGMETQRVPMMQGAFFTYAAFGLMFAAVALTRTVGQAALASLVLMAAPGFVGSGAGLISDVPLTFFIFAACVMIYCYFLFRQSNLLILAGFMAGLAAWTKNEGLLFVAVSLPVLAWTSRKDGPGAALWYLAGLAVPMAVVLYFKIALAPPGDLFASGAGSMLASITDPWRYWIVLKAVLAQVWGFSGWPVSIFIQLAIYAVIMQFNFRGETYPGLRVLAGMLVLQLLGYCVIYVLTPHDLEWHLGTSINRLVLHLYPSIVFLFFNMVSEPETAFRRLAGSSK
jgi:hypothetical protein